MNLANWYKSIVESNNESSPSSVWEGIQDELDIQLVWTKIDQSLGAPKRNHRFIYYAVAASLFLGLTLSSFLYFMQLIQPKTSELTDDIKLVNESRSNVNSTDESKDFRVTAVETNIIAANVPVNMHSTSSDIVPNRNVLNNTQEEVDHVSFVNPMPISNVHLESFDFDSPSHIDIFSDTKLFDEPKRALNSLYIGFTGQLANTWMLSNKTFQGMKSDEFTATNASFGKNLGFFVGTALTPKVGVKSELFILSQSKQNYNEYLNGKYVSNNFELDYYTFTLQVNYLLKENNRSHRFMLGGYTGFLHNATQSISGVESTISNEYSNFDYGLIIGYEYPIAIGRALTFSPGLSTKIGLTNVFSGNDIIPYYLNRTQNASINLMFSLSYSIY
jgi:hypothetical protein